MWGFCPPKETRSSNGAGFFMGERHISVETAQRIAAVWPSSSSMAEAMARAGVKTKDSKNQRRYRRQAEQILGIQLPSLRPECARRYPEKAERLNFRHETTAVVFSDAHWWPNSATPAYYLLLEVLADLSPDVVIDNGDSWDGASISRHDPTTFEQSPSLDEELAACRGYLDGIREAAGEAQLYRNIGNHDLRFEAYLAKNAPAMKGMPGTTASELFPGWAHNFSVMLNDTVFIKHRWHGGVHAAWNNTLKAGKSVVTGHTHRLTIREYTDLNGTRYGIETGTLADPYGPQFFYCEDNPVNWQQGFIVLTIDGSDLYPEKVEMKDGKKAFFRGKWYS